jgi:hypothetical protein
MEHRRPGDRGGAVRPMAEAQSPSGSAIHQFSKYRSHLLYAERKQLDAGCWEPAAHRLLRRALMNEIWAAILALMVFGSIFLDLRNGRFPSPLTILFYGALSVSCVREAGRLRKTVSSVREAAGARV